LRSRHPASFGPLPVEGSAPRRYSCQQSFGGADDRQDRLGVTDRHHRFLLEKVRQGVFATQRAAVAAAVEQMIHDEAARNTAIQAPAQEVRASMETQRDGFIEQDDAFVAARAAARNA
jgi:antitoxin ParD1/3/4